MLKLLRKRSQELECLFSFVKHAVFWPRWENHWLLELSVLADLRAYVQYYWGECFTQHKYPSSYTPERVLGPFRARRLFKSPKSYLFCRASFLHQMYPNSLIAVSTAAVYIAPCPPWSHQKLTLPSGEAWVNQIPLPKAVLAWRWALMLSFPC